MTNSIIVFLAGGCRERNPRHRGGGIGLCLREVQWLGYTTETEEI